MPNVKLQIVFDGKVYNAQIGFKFKTNFNIKDDHLFCAEFDPPLNVHGTEQKFINFTDFLFQGFGFVFFAPHYFYYNFQDTDKLSVMKIIEHGNMITI